jgi:hypothetical protein
MNHDPIPTDLQVGDLVYIVNMAGEVAYLNGTEGQIVGPEGVRLGFAPTLGSMVLVRGFEVQISADEIISVPAKCLRRRRPKDSGEMRVLELFNRPPVAVPQFDEVGA